MNLAWPWVFLLLPLPWLLRRWQWGAPDQPALRVPALADYAHTAVQGVTHRPGRVDWLSLLIWLLLLLAASRPQWLTDMAPRTLTGRDLFLAFDISASMGTRDLEWQGRSLERLQAARLLAQDFLARREGDRVGLIVFGSRAYEHTALTPDLAAVKAALETAGLGMAGRETALGDAVALAVKRMQQRSGAEKVLVLLTDGANTAGELSPSRAMWLAQREGVRIHAVGVGASQDRNLDEEVLREMAGRTGGRYARATDGAALAAFFKGVDEQERMERKQSVSTERELYPWPLALALVLAVWMHGRGRRS